MNQHQSIAELYATLCGKFRQLKRDEYNQTRVCVHCSKPESEHVNDNHCTCYLTSRTFKATAEEEQNKVEQSLLLLEQLAEVQGWKL